VSKIIVGVDGSDRSKDALALATRLARHTGAEIELVCAYPYDDHPTGPAGGQEFRRYPREDAEDTLALVQEGISDLPQLATRTIADHSPARALQTLAERDGVSLIVIGSSHRGDTGRVLAGTTAERLLHGAPCPVAVAPRGFHVEDETSIRTIAVGWDGSPESRAALVGATAVARSLGAQLHVVEVLDMDLVGTPALMSAPGFYKPPREIEEHARKALEHLVAGLPADVHAEPLVKVGDPAYHLVAHSENVDLLVVGSRGYGPHRAVLLGSVSGRLVRKAACPVLVVPRGIEAPLETLFSPAYGTELAG
jgi:nucleotide-binding universal stress UspA family protein